MVILFFPNGVNTTILYGVQGNWLGRLARMGSGHDIASGAAMKCAAAPVGPPTEKGRTMSPGFFYALLKKNDPKKKIRFSRKTRVFVNFQKTQAKNRDFRRSLLNTPTKPQVR